MPKPDPDATLRQLREILREYEPHLVTVRDGPEELYLDTAHVLPNGKPLFFGSVRVGRQHVSFHLMPVYLWPALLDDVPEALRKRMQGKSCFNFRHPDPELFSALAALARRGFERYRAEGYVGA
jgi:hypothetical protein